MSPVPPICLNDQTDRPCCSRPAEGALLVDNIRHVTCELCRVLAQTPSHLRLKAGNA